MENGDVTLGFNPQIGDKAHVLYYSDIHPCTVIKRTKKYHAHDEENKFKEGEEVSIIECKPISKKKTWQVVKS